MTDAGGEEVGIAREGGTVGEEREMETEEVWRELRGQ